MQFIVSIVVGLALLASVNTGGAEPLQDPDRDVVATVGDDYVITIGELDQYVKDRLYYSVRTDKAAAYREALDAMIDARLKQVDFFARGLQRDEALLHHLQRRITEELVVAYFERHHVGRYVNDASIRDAYEQMSRQVEYREIVLRKPPTDPPGARDSVEATISRIRSAIDEGEDFGALVRQYTQDPRARQTGGYGQPVTWRQSLSTPFAQVVFDLEVGDVRTFETSGTYRIVRVERLGEREVPPFDSTRDEIVKKLRTHFVESAYQNLEREKVEAIDTTSVRWNQAGLSQVVEWSRTPRFYEENYQDTLQHAIDSDGDLVIMSYSGGQVDLEEFKRLLDDVLVMRSSPRRNVAEVKDFILEALRIDHIAQQARQMGLENDLLQLDSPSPVLKRGFVSLYDRRFIDERMPKASNDALRSFYEAQRDSLFYQRAVVRTRMIVRSDKDEIDELWARYEAGASFSELSHRLLMRSFERTSEGNIEVFRKGETSTLGEVAFSLDTGEAVGPISFEGEEGTQYAIIECTDRREAGPLEYAEVVNVIEQRFTEYHRASLAAEVANTLRAKYSVTINHDALERHLSNDDGSHDIFPSMDSVLGQQ